MTQAAADVLAERARQISDEGWTPEYDDQWTKGQLRHAASCYALNYRHYAAEVTRNWPWASFWKPSTERRDLVKAGALILAEIERLDRAAARTHGGAS